MFTSVTSGTGRIDLVSFFGLSFFLSFLHFLSVSLLSAFFFLLSFGQLRHISVHTHVYHESSDRLCKKQRKGQKGKKKKELGKKECRQ